MDRRATGCVLRGAGWLLLLLLPVAPSHADEPSYAFDEAWRWVPYSTESGLPSNRALDVVETASGEIWARTDRGVAWFDGFGWHPLDGSVIEALIPDLEGGLLALFQERVFRVDKDGLVPLPVSHPGRPLSIRSATPLAEHAWVFATAQGLFRYDEQTGSLESMPVPPDMKPLSEEDVSVQRTRSGTVWLNTFSSGLYKWTGRAWKRWSGIGMSLLREDGASGLMSVTANPKALGLWEWREDGRLQRVPESGTTLVAAMDRCLAGAAVVALIDGRVLVQAADRWQVLEEPVGPLSYPHFVRCQSNGDLWVGAVEALYLFRQSSTRWRRWPLDVPGANSVNTLLRTRTEDLWIGTDAGISILSTDGSARHLGAILDTTLMAVTGLAEDRQGGIWVSSGSGFPGAFRLYEGRWRHYGAADGLDAPYVHRIVPDRQGRLWFLGLPAFGPVLSSAEPGAFVYDGGRFVRWGVQEGLLSGRVYSVAEGPHGELWFGTSAALSRWQDGTWRHWTEDDGLRSSRVFTLAVDARGRIWFGHQQFGLGYLDDDGRPDYLTSADGLIDDRIWEIQVGPDEALWIGTAGGLARYHEGVFASFGERVGLAHPRVWPILPMQDRVYLGTIGGSVYELGLEEANHPPPQVRIVSMRGHSSEAQTYFYWSAQAYRGELLPGQVLTRTRLDSGSWSEWSTVREATVISPSSGRHIFEVQAKGLFGRINDYGGKVSFKIPAPFYLHPLFLAVFGLWVAGMAGFGWVTWRRHRRQHALLRQRGASLAEAQRIAQLGNYEIDLATGRLTWSKEMYRIHGVTPDAFSGHAEEALHELIHPDDVEDVREGMQRLVQMGRPLSREYRIIRPDDAVRWVMRQGRLVKDPQGRPLKVVGTVQDVTERKQGEEAVRRAQDALLRQQQRERRRVEVELARAKDRLVRQTRLATIGQIAASIAHELRNPLGAIRNAIYVLNLRKEADEQWRQYLQIIDKEVGATSRIIGDLLDLSRTREPEKEQVDLRAAVREALLRIQPPEGVTLSCRFDPEPFLVLADPVLFHQVLVNLLVNAVQAMDGRGCIEVTARHDAGYHTIILRDDGPGVPSAVAEEIFEPLFTTKASGTGLGLAICRQIIARHGGSISLLPTATGAVFQIRLLPAKNPASNRTATASRRERT